MMDYIRQIFSFTFAVSVMYMLLDCEIQQKKNSYLLGIYALTMLMVDGYVFFKFGYTDFMKFYPLIVHLPVFIAFVLLSKFNVIKVFFVHWTVVAISTSITLVGLFVSYFFGSSREVVNIVSYILYAPTWYIIYKYIRPSFLYMMRSTDKGWIGFSMIPLAYSLLIYNTGMFDLNKVVIASLFKNAALFFILAFSAYFLILRLFKQTREQLTLQNEQNLLKMQIDAAKVRLGALEESRKKSVLYRHDMRHHLNLIDAYLADNNNAGAQKYIEEVEKGIDSAVVERYCSNYTVNLLLYSYISKAKDENIKIETHINLPEENTVSDMDLCVVFGNAVENAVNACKRVSGENERAIKIVCKKENDKLFIQIINSFEGTVTFADDMPVAPEEDHGLGTKSIAAVAQKYGGVYSFAAENGVFKTSVIL